MLLIPFLIPKGQYTEKGLYGLKNTLNSEGTKRSRKRRRTRQHKSKKGEERQDTGSINCEFWCVEYTV
jgi:hypothetical protein